MNKKLLFIIPYFKAGGTERQLYYLSKGLAKRNYDVKIICIEKKGAFINLFEDLDVEILYLNVKFKKSNILKILFKIYKNTKKEEYDIIISRAWNSNKIASFTYNFFNVSDNLILFLSGSTNYKPNFIKLIIDKYFLNKADKILSVSKQAKLNCIKNYNISDGKIEIFRNGTDINFLQNKSLEKIDDFNFNRREIILLFVGKLSHRKGVDILLKSLSILNNKNIKFKALFIGGGKIEYYKKSSVKLDLTNKVYFLGKKTNPYKYMKKSDLFIMPSRSEGFPNVLLEAMALKLPVISSDCETGPREIINQNKNGLLVEPENYKELANKIIYLINNECKREKLAMNAFETIKNKYTIKNQLNVFLNLLNNI